MWPAQDILKMYDDDQALVDELCRQKAGSHVSALNPSPSQGSLYSENYDSFAAANLFSPGFQLNLNKITQRV